MIILIYGSQESGKTTKARKIVHTAKQAGIPEPLVYDEIVHPTNEQLEDIKFRELLSLVTIICIQTNEKSPGYRIPDWLQCIRPKLAIVNTDKNPFIIERSPSNS